MATINNQQKITPFLWFDKEAQDAAKFYTTVFKNSRIIKPHPMVTTFELEGVQFMALNAGPMFKFNEAVSFFISCESQDEIDYYWNKLTGDGGMESRCGWLKDKYGLSWQVVPSKLGEYMSDPDPKKRENVMKAFMEMKKFDIQKLDDAYHSK